MAVTGFTRRSSSCLESRLVSARQQVRCSFGRCNDDRLPAASVILANLDTSFTASADMTMPDNSPAVRYSFAIDIIPPFASEGLSSTLAEIAPSGLGFAFIRMGRGP